MKIRASAALLFSLALSSTPNAVAAWQTVSFEKFTLAYSDVALGNDLDFTFSDEGHIEFGWNIPPDFVADSSGSNQEFGLVSFSVFANEGFRFTGEVSVFVGNLPFVEAGAWTSPTLTGEVLIDGLGAPAGMIVGSMNKTVTYTTDALRTGYYSYAASFDHGSFSYLSLMPLNLHAGIPDPGAIIFSTGQAEVRFSLAVAPVPEPSTYAMFMIGLGVLSLLSARRGPRQDI